MLGPGSSLGRITTNGDTVRAEIVGPTHPPSLQDMAAGLSRALGRPVTIQLGVDTRTESRDPTPPQPRPHR